MAKCSVNAVILCIRTIYLSVDRLVKRTQGTVLEIADLACSKSDIEQSIRIGEKRF
jgi:hypothetical protein